MNESGGTLKGYLKLMRLHNAVIGGASIFIGAFLTGTLSPYQALLIAVVSGMLITSAANAINDFYDAETDAINKPERPIPAGTLSAGRARVFALVLYILGLVLAISINTYTATIAITAVAASYAYSARFKRMPVMGNVTVALIASMAFVFGGAAVGRTEAALYPALFAFFFHLGREVIKDMEDAPGDSLTGAETLPVRFGGRSALIFLTISYVVLIALTFLPFFFGTYGITYLLVVLPGVDLVLIYVLISAWSDPGRANLARLSGLLKVDMIVGLLALYLGVH